MLLPNSLSQAKFNEAGTELKEATTKAVRNITSHHIISYHIISHHIKSHQIYFIKIAYFLSKTSSFMNHSFRWSSNSLPSKTTWRNLPKSIASRSQKIPCSVHNSMTCAQRLELTLFHVFSLQWCQSHLFLLTLPAQKSFWSELLGVNDFYYELGVQIIEACLATRASNGGLIPLDALYERIKMKRGAKAQAISLYYICLSLIELLTFEKKHCF